uniref:DUF559 domain-containing protein n=1 Tax=Megasphaera elsdenii TaxID=907 RepID=UPI00242B20C9
LILPYKNGYLSTVCCDIAIEKNMQRDRESEAALNGLGFTVLRFWSRDVLRSPDVCVDTVKKAVLKNKLNVD